MKIDRMSKTAIRAWLKRMGYKATVVNRLKLDDPVGDIYALHGVEKGG